MKRLVRRRLALAGQLKTIDADLKVHARRVATERHLIMPLSVDQLLLEFGK